MVRTSWWLSLLVLGGCGAAGSPDASPGAGLGQGGAQDFGEFRSILDDGGIPGPATLDARGFFAEHVLALPQASCGLDVCIHAGSGAMANLVSGDPAMVVMIGLNTPIEPSEAVRPPLNLAIVVDVSGSMSGTPLAGVHEGLLRMLDELRADDRVSLVAFADTATTLAESVAGDDPALVDAINALEAGGMTNIYDGLRSAYGSLASAQALGRYNRVILVSDGEATTGITSEARLVEMSRSYNAGGYALSTVGIGDAFNPRLMRELAEVGSGSFYFLEHAEAVKEVFEQEVGSSLVPVAEDVRIELDLGVGYTVHSIYGATLVRRLATGAVIELPLLQIAGRADAAEHVPGRRGGGGAIVAVLTRSAAAPSDHVGDLSLDFRKAGSSETFASQALIPAPPTDLEPGGWWSGAAARKSFVMVNLYAGFEMASERAAYGDDRGALGALLPLGESVRAWVETTPDEDIAADLRYLDRFVANLRARGALEPASGQRPPDPWPAR